jgi:hypothetical protein
MQVHSSIFKAYDIRGVVGQTIDETFAEHLGRAFGSEARLVGQKAVAVGRDGRLSGAALAAAVIRGLKAAGLDVVDLGAVTTPMLYYVAATRGKHGCNSGIMVTGSHNPKDYNGFKMVMAGRAIYGADIQRLRQRIEREDLRQGQGPQRTDGDRRRIQPPHRQRLQAVAPDEDRGRFGQRHSWCVGAGHPARAGLRGGRTVLRGRRRLPQPPPRPQQAREPGRPDQGREEDQGRGRPGLRRRRRPPGRGHQGWQHHLPRPPDHAVRARRAVAQPGRHHHLRRQVLAARAGGHPRSRRRAAAVEDRPFADQGQAEGDQRAVSPAR